MPELLFFSVDGIMNGIIRYCFGFVFLSFHQNFFCNFQNQKEMGRWAYLPFGPFSTGSLPFMIIVKQYVHNKTFAFCVIVLSIFRQVICIMWLGYSTFEPLKIFTLTLLATCIEPDQPAHLCSLIRLHHHFGWPTIRL